MKEKFLTYIKLHWRDILLFVLIGVIVILLTNTTCISRNNTNLKNNVRALTDSVQVLETKNGDLLYAKQSLILEKKELEEYLGISNKKISELEKKLDSKIAYIAKLEGSVKIDTVYLNDSVNIVDDTVFIYFNENNKWYTIDGETKYFNCESNTRINTIEMNVPLTLALTDDYKVSVLSENPYVRFNNINGAVVENSVIKPREKKFGLTVGVGPYVGYGGNLNANGFNTGLEFGVAVALILGYHVVSF